MPDLDPDLPVAAEQPPDVDGLPSGESYADPYADPNIRQDDDSDPQEPSPLAAEDDDLDGGVTDGQRAFRMPVSMSAATLLARANAQVGRWYPPAMCLNFVRSLAGAPAGVPSAAVAWRLARNRHVTGTPPPGSIMYWVGGSHGFGHIAVAGQREWTNITTDVPRGRVGVVPSSFFSRVWGLTYAGWADNVNGVLVAQPAAAPPAPPAVSLRNVAPGKRNADVGDLQRALRAAGYKRLNPSGVTGFYGGETRRMVQQLQHDRRLHGHAGVADRAVCQALRLRVTA